MSKIFFFIVSISLCWSANKIFFPQFELINIHDDYQYSMSKLLQSYTQERDDIELVLSTNDSNSHPENNKWIRTQAAKNNCEQYIQSNLIRIGEKVLVSIALYNTVDGKKVWYDKLKAANPDDLDPILQKFATAIGTSNKAAEDGSIYNVTQEDSRKLKKIQTHNTVGAAIGGIASPADNFKDNPFMSGFGFFWSYDSRDLLINVDFHSMPSGKNSAILTSLGIYHPFSPQNNTFFLGGGLGYSSISLQTKDRSKAYSDSGLLAYAGGGFLLNRNSTVQVRIHTRYFLGLFEMSNPDETIPHGLMFGLEIGYGK